MDVDGILTRNMEIFSVILTTLVTLTSPLSYCKPSLVLVSTVPQVVVAGPCVYFHTYVLLVAAICTIHPVYCKRSRAKVDVMCHNSSHASLNRSLPRECLVFTEGVCVCVKAVVSYLFLVGYHCM